MRKRRTGNKSNRLQNGEAVRKIHEIKLKHQDSYCIWILEALSYPCSYKEYSSLCTALMVKLHDFNSRFMNEIMSTIIETCRSIDLITWLVIASQFICTLLQQIVESSNVLNMAVFIRVYSKWTLIIIKTNNTCHLSVNEQVTLIPKKSLVGNRRVEKLKIVAKCPWINGHYS